MTLYLSSFVCKKIFEVFVNNTTLNINNVGKSQISVFFVLQIEGDFV